MICALHAVYESEIHIRTLQILQEQSLCVSLLHTHTPTLNVRKQSPIKIFSTEHSPLSSIKWVQKSELFMFLPQIEWCDNSMNYTFLLI